MGAVTGSGAGEGVSRSHRRGSAPTEAAFPSTAMSQAGGGPSQGEKVKKKTKSIQQTPPRPLLFCPLCVTTSNALQEPIMVF